MGDGSLWVGLIKRQGALPVEVAHDNGDHFWCGDAIGLLPCWYWGFEHEQCHWVFAILSLVSCFLFYFFFSSLYLLLLIIFFHHWLLWWFGTLVRVFSPSSDITLRVVEPVDTKISYNHLIDESFRCTRIACIGGRRFTSYFRWLEVFCFCSLIVSTKSVV